VNGTPVSPANGTVQQACIGTGCPLVSPFSLLGSPTPAGGINGSFAQSANQLTGAIISGTPFSAPASANTAAQTQLTGFHKTDTTPGEVQLAAGFVFKLGGTGSSTIDISFNATTRNLAGTDAQGLTAQAASSYEIKITCAQAVCGSFTQNQTVFDWKPDGTNGLTGGTLVSAGVNLNDTRNENFPAQQNDSGVLAGFFDGEVTLLNGVQYNFNITQVDSVNGQSVPAVPEPATMGLFAVGLLGLGFAARRRSQRT
jgi:PEP-CTERM motif-containing protein